MNVFIRPEEVAIATCFSIINDSRNFGIFIKIRVLCAKALAKHRAIATEASFNAKVIGLLRELKRRCLAAIPPAIFLAITFYFAWNAVHGARGLEAQAAERTELAQARLQFATVDAARQQWEMKIAALGNQSIDPDMLDAELRQILSLAGPADLVVNLPAPPAK